MVFSGVYGQFLSSYGSALRNIKSIINVYDKGLPPNFTPDHHGAGISVI